LYTEGIFLTEHKNAHRHLEKISPASCERFFMYHSTD